MLRLCKSRSEIRRLKIDDLLFTKGEIELPQSEDVFPGKSPEESITKELVVSSCQDPRDRYCYAEVLI